MLDQDIVSPTSEIRETVSNSNEWNLVWKNQGKRCFVQLKQCQMLKSSLQAINCEIHHEGKVLTCTFFMRLLLLQKEVPYGRNLMT